MSGDTTIVIVDDDESFCHSLQVLLTAVGLHAKAYKGAQSFLDDYDPDLPGCLLLDISMPEISGVQLLATLMERSIRIPVIVISACSDEDLTEQAKQRGAFDVVRKPYSVPLLLKRIREALEVDAADRTKQVGP